MSEMDEQSRRAFVAAAGGFVGLAPIIATPALAQTRNANADQRGRVFVEAFGAKGDGSTDDSGAIQAAIDAVEAAGGGTVLLGSRRYELRNEIRIDPTLTSLLGSHSSLALARNTRTGVLLQVTSKAGSPAYGQGTQVIEGINFIGPGSGFQSVGILLTTPAEGKSSRITVRNCVVRDFMTGIQHHDRCYLTQHFSVQIFSVRIGMAFTSGVDAGENTSLFGCSIFNADIAIHNPLRTNIFCYGSSFDYCRQWIVGGGLMNFFGCWFEKHRPMAEVDYPFEIDSGRLLLSGGGLQISGQDFEQGSQCRYYFMLKQKQDEAVVDRAFGWNLRTKSGALAGGEGTLRMAGLGMIGRLFVPAVTKDDDSHNVFGSGGSFEGKNIGISCWVESDGAERLGKHKLAWKNNGATYAEGTAETSADLARSGSQSLKLAKGIGAGTAFTFNLLGPLQPDDAFGLRFFWKSVMPNAADGQFWVQIHFAQVIGTDPQGVPEIGDRAFWGESAHKFSDGRDDWVGVSFSSYDLQESSPTRCRAPAWATHALVSFNFISAPQGSKFYIDDLGGFTM